LIIFFRQLGQYLDIIRNCRDRRYYIIGDGPGTASIACMMLDVPYFSMEPNDIGSKARSLGIITSDSFGELYEDDIVFLANVGDYVDYSLYADNDKIIVDYSGIEQDGLVRCEGGRGSVYASMDISLTSFPRRSDCLGLLRDKEVYPTTPLAKQMCVENGIEVLIERKENAYLVTTDPCQDQMNMVSKELPSDSRARVGHIKKAYGVFFLHIMRKGRKYLVKIVLQSTFLRVIAVLNMYGSFILMVKLYMLYLLDPKRLEVSVLMMDVL